MSDSHYTSRSPREPPKNEAYAKISISRAETIARLGGLKVFYEKIPNREAARHDATNEAPRIDLAARNVLVQTHSTALSTG